MGRDLSGLFAGRRLRRPFRTPTAFPSSSPGLRSPDRYPGTQRPAKRFNPNGVAPQTPFPPPSRPEPLCGSIVTPPVPRVGLIPFGRPWAGGRKPFGLGGGDHPGLCHGLVYFAPLGLGIVRRPSQAVYGSSHRSQAPPSGDSRGDWGHTNRLGNPGLGPILPACSRGDGWDAPSGRLRRSSPPAQGCGRQTATLGPNVPRNGSTPTGLHPKRGSRLRPGRNRFAVQSLLRPFPGWASFHSADPGLEAVSPSGLGGDDHPALPWAGLFRPVGAGNRPATIAGRLWELASITGPSIGRFGTDKQTPPGAPNANGFARP
jgi:hypothetical protein